MSLSLSRCYRNIFRVYRQPTIPRPIPTAIVPTRTFFTNLPHYAKKDYTPSTLVPATSSTGGLRPASNQKFPPEGGLDPRAVFSDLDVLSGLPTPASAVDAVFTDGFLLNNGQRVQGDGVFLLNNDVFRWKALIESPNSGVNGGAAGVKAKKSGVLELDDEVWGLLDVVYPKPDLLIIGTGHRTLLLHPKNRKRLQDMGLSLDVLDTHNAAAEYNMLATERPGGQVAAALLTAEFGR